MLKLLKILKRYCHGIIKRRIWKVNHVGSLGAYDETDSDKSRRFLARHLKKLNEFMEKDVSEFKDFAKDTDAKSWLSFTSDESGGKKLNEYTPQLNLIEPISAQNSKDSLTIDYRVSQLKDTPRLAKPFANFKFDGITRWAPAFLIALVAASSQDV